MAREAAVYCGGGWRRTPGQSGPIMRVGVAGRRGGEVTSDRSVTRWAVPRAGQAGLFPGYPGLLQILPTTVPLPGRFRLAPRPVQLRQPPGGVGVDEGS